MNKDKFKWKCIRNRRRNDFDIKTPEYILHEKHRHSSTISTLFNRNSAINHFKGLKISYDCKFIMVMDKNHITVNPNSTWIKIIKLDLKGKVFVMIRPTLMLPLLLYKLLSGVELIWVGECTEKGQNKNAILTFMEEIKFERIFSFSMKKNEELYLWRKYS